MSFCDNLLHCARLQIEILRNISKEEKIEFQHYTTTYGGVQAKSKVDVVKLLSINIAVRNTTHAADKQGNWAAFFRLVKSESMATVRGPYMYKSILEIPAAKSATAREDLEIRIPRFPTYWQCRYGSFGR
jgi:hypothetical protein